MNLNLTFILPLQDRDESTGSDSSVKKRRGEDVEKHRSDKQQNGSDEKRKSSSDRKRL